MVGGFRLGDWKYLLYKFLQLPNETRTPTRNAYNRNQSANVVFIIKGVNPINLCNSRPGTPTRNSYNWVPRPKGSKFYNLNILRKNLRVSIVLRSNSRAFTTRICRSSRRWFFFAAYLSTKSVVQNAGRNRQAQGGYQYAESVAGIG